MNTPIYDFVRTYIDSDKIRMHMPGHKGKSILGCEPSDITEISGADVLYSADGIISESENNASALFGSAHSFYSTEGSSLAIKAMLALAAYDGDITPKPGERPLVLAARNIHKAFIHACALLDLEASFILPSSGSHLCRCDITPADVSTALEKLQKKPCAVYVTSPDYLGNMLDIEGISRVCKQHGVPLLVDNAHGAYLAFLSPPLHPMALGADMCCDSAHKTLPAMTGAAYLHISKNASENFIKNARTRLSLFASTSPSYLILQSLDICNKYISDGYTEKLTKKAMELDEIKTELISLGFELEGNEPMKLTVSLEGDLSGEAAADLLRLSDIECEYCDRTRLTLMISTENTCEELEKLKKALLSLPIQEKNSNTATPPNFIAPKFETSIREAVLSPQEQIPVSSSIGRVCASPTVSCPPAIPIAVSGEKISAQTAEILEFYGIHEISVVKA